MKLIDLIYRLYDGNIIFHSPFTSEKPDNIPDELFSILKNSNGIEETMIINGKSEPIQWIIYSCNEIEKETHYYSYEYGIKGVVFSSNGAGNPFILKADGKVVEFDAIDNEELLIADSLTEFFS